MTNRVRWLAALLVVPCGVCAAAEVKDAQLKDAVELLPAHTLACLELRQPAQLSRQVRALLKGSVLDDMPRLLAKKRSDKPGYRYSPERDLLAGMSFFLSPEMIDEGARIRGGVIALTGFAKDATPEGVGLLQNGTSNFPGMFMRGFLTFDRPRVVGEIEGISLYREISYVYSAVKPGLGGPGGAPMPQWHESGPVMGQMPGLVMMGSSVDSLKDVVRRAKRKTAEASLANLRAFKDPVLRGRPGLFAYVDVAALEGKWSELNGGKDGPGARALTELQTVVGKGCVEKLLLSLALHNGALEGQMRVDLNDKNASPLLGLLPDRPAPRELLHFAPDNVLLAVSCGLGDAEKRWKTFVELLDATYQRRGGIGDQPSVAIRELQKKVNLHIDKDVLAQLSGAGLIVHKDWYAKPKQWTLLLRAVDADAAAALEKTGLPRLLSLGGEEVQSPREEQVKGQRIKSIGEEGRGVPFFPLHYGRGGSVLVLGPDRDAVAAALSAGSKKEGLLGQSKVAEALKDIDDKAPLVGVLSPSRAALGLFALLSRPSVRPMMKLPANVPPPPPQAIKPLEETKKVQELRKGDEPLVFSLTRQPDHLLMRMRPLSLRRLTPRLLDVWVEAMFKRIDARDAGGDGGFGIPVPGKVEIKR